MYTFHIYLLAIYYNSDLQQRFCSTCAPFLIGAILSHSQFKGTKLNCEEHLQVCVVLFLSSPFLYAIVEECVAELVLIECWM